MSSIAQRLVDRAKSSPTEPAVRQFKLGIWEQKTWAELLTDVGVVRTALGNAGVKPGDVVALLSENSNAAVTFAHAALNAGAVLLVVPADLAPGTTRSVLRAASAKVVLAGDQEQFDKVIGNDDSVDSVTFVMVDNTRGVRQLDRADRSDASRCGSLELARSGVTAGDSTPVPADGNDRALLVVDVVGGAVELRSVTHNELSDCADQTAAALALKQSDSIFSQRALADGQQLALTLAASPTLGLVTHIPGIGTEVQGLGQVQPAALLVDPAWLTMVSAQVDRRSAATTGIKKLALGRGLRRSAPAGLASSGQRLPKTRLFGVFGAALVIVWWCISMSTNDVLRIAIALALVLLVGAALVFSGNAVADPLRRQLGLSRCRAVSVPSGSVGDDALGLFGAVGVPAVSTPPLKSTIVTTVSSEVLS